MKILGVIVIIWMALLLVAAVVTLQKVGRIEKLLTPVECEEEAGTIKNDTAYNIYIDSGSVDDGKMSQIENEYYDLIRKEVNTAEFKKKRLKMLEKEIEQMKGKNK